jgi:hypothetical protein
LSLRATSRPSSYETDCSPRFSRRAMAAGSCRRSHLSAGVSRGGRPTTTCQDDLDAWTMPVHFWRPLLSADACRLLTFVSMFSRDTGSST